MAPLGLPTSAFTATLVLVIAVTLTLARPAEVPAVGVLDQSVSLPCPTIPDDLVDKLQWADFVYNSDRNPKIIYDAAGNTDMHIKEDHPRKDAYTLDRKYTLTIDKVTMDDAGVYFCRIKNEDGSYTDLRKHRLAVMGIPKCSGTTSLKAGENTDLSCEVLANSNEVPNLTWLFGGQSETGDDESTLEVFKTNLPVKATWAEDQQTYTCNVSISGKSANCQLKLDVQYPVRDIQITPMKDSYAVGDRIKCEAKGNPAPTIEWDPPVKGKMGHGFKSFVIPEEWKGKAQTLKCTASNMVASEASLLEKTITFTPTGSESETMGTVGPEPASSSEGLENKTINITYTGSDSETEGPEPGDSSNVVEPKPIKTVEEEAANTNGAAACGPLQMSLLSGLALPAILALVLCTTTAPTTLRAHGAAILVLVAILATGGGIPKTAIIIGAAIGAVVLIMVIAAIIVARRKSNKKKKGHMQIPTSDHEDVKKPIDAKGGSPGSRTPKGADRNSNGIASYQQGGRYPAYITSTPEDLDPDTPWRRQSEAV